jgi:hypothetical protein
MLRTPFVPALAAVLLAGCAPSAVLMTPPPTVKPPPGQENETTGEVTFSAGGLGTRVAYGPWRVSGPGIDLRYAGDGTWTGQLSGGDVRIQAQQGMVTGPGVQLLVNQDGRALAIRGTWAGRQVDLLVGSKGLQGSMAAGTCTIELRPAGAGTMTGTLGCSGVPGGAASSGQGTLLLGGEAFLAPDVLLPQFVLALLAALPT